MSRSLALLISLSLVLAACSGLPASARQRIDPGTRVSDPAANPVANNQIETVNTPAALPEPPTSEDQEIRKVPTNAPQSEKQAGLPPTSSPDCSLAPSDSGIVTVRWDEPLRPSQLIVVDPVSELPLCEYPAYLLRDHFSHAFSEDGKTLAIVDYSETQAHQDLLHLIDLQTWTAITTTLEMGSWTAAISFNPAGTHLGLIYGRNRHPKPQYTFASLNLATLEVEASAPLDFAPHLLKYSRDGASILVFGGNEGAREDQLLPAHAVLLNATDLSTLWEQELAAIRIGTSEMNVEDDNMPIFVYWRPAVALSPDRTRLYVVHADEDKLTTIDFGRRDVKTVDILPKLSWIERLVYRFAQVAYAKVSNGTYKNAVLSPDGKLLYVSGQTDRAGKDSKGEWQFTNTPLGLQVIDVATGTELARLDTQSNSVIISPDGVVLYLTGWDDAGEWTDVVAADTLEVIQRLPRTSVLRTRSLGGQPVLLASRQSDVSVRLALLDPGNPDQVTAWPSRRRVYPGYPLLWEP